MGIFDAFTTKNADAAAAAQQAALKAGQTQATGDINTGFNNLDTTFNTGAAPINANQAVDSAGVAQLAKLLGFGPGGSGDIQTTLQNLPGYQFQLNQGTQNAERTGAAQGFGTGPGGVSGNVLKAVTDYANGLASSSYGNYATQLQPFLGASTTTAGQSGALAGAKAGLQTGLTGQQAGIDYGTNVGIGNAQASADLAGNTASANAINALMGGGRLAANLFGFLGGNNNG